MEALLLSLSASFLAGLLTRRLVVFVVPILLVTGCFLALAEGWVGAGLEGDWHWIFKWVVAYAVVATAIGLGARLVIDRVGRGVGGRRWTARWSAGAVIVWLASIAVYSYASSRPADVTAIKHARGPELYYLGASFEGLRLSHADDSPRGGFFVYGDCEIPLGRDEGGCSPPLQIQNVTCPGEPTAVVVFGGEGGLAQRAAGALQLLRGRGTSPRIAIGNDPFGRCFAPPEGPSAVQTITR